MKNTQTFSNKMVDLTGMQDYERITAEFNRLTKDYYAKEKNPVQRFRTLRQIRIRLASAKKVYEVAGKESEYIIRLLKNEEEIVLMFASQAKGSDLSPTENRALRLNCINGGRCGIQEIAAVFERLFGVRLPHIYNRLLAIRNRKNGRTPFLKWLSEQIERDADQKDE